MTKTSQEWIIVYVTNNEPEAYIIVGRLEAYGIEAWLNRESLGSSMGITFGPIGEIRVVVRAEDFEQARALLDEEPEVLSDDNDRTVFDPSYEPAE